MAPLLLYLPALLACAAGVLSLPSVSTVYTFPNETWVENLAIRSNGHILATSPDRFELYLVDPRNAGQACLVHDFGKQSPGGIAEIEHDVFAVVTVEYGEFLEPVNGSAVAWKVDVKDAECVAGTLTPSPEVSVIANLTDAILLNGVTTLDKSHVLISDSFLAVVWRLDWHTGRYAVALSDESMEGGSSSPTGVDGIHLHAGFAYYSNFAGNFLARVAIHANGTAAGLYETFATVAKPDDFVITPDGTLFVAGNNTLWEVSASGTVSAIAGGANETVLVGATSAQLGRTAAERGIVYVTTNGGEGDPVDGQVLPGKVAAVTVGC